MPTSIELSGAQMKMLNLLHHDRKKNEPTGIFTVQTRLKFRPVGVEKAGKALVDAGFAKPHYPSGAFHRALGLSYDNNDPTAWSITEAGIEYYEKQGG